MKRIKIGIVIIIYLAGSITCYSLKKDYATKIKNKQWTVGERNVALIWSSLSWCSAAGVYACYPDSLTGMNKPSNW